LKFLDLLGRKPTHCHPKLSEAEIADVNSTVTLEVHPKVNEPLTTYRWVGGV
jgi:hypothetical protein